MTDARQYSIPREPGRWRAFTLAFVIHLALLGVLWFSVRWQTETPIAVEAEVWSPQAREAAPPPPPPRPVVEAKPEPVPPPPPRPVVVEPPRINPDIALQADKKRKEKLLKEQQEDEARQEKKLAEKKRIEKEKLLDQDKKHLAEEAKKRADEKKLKLEKAEAEAADKIRAQELKRITAQSGAGSSGEVARSQGPRGDPSYGSRIAAKIKSNTVFYVPENVSGNPPVEYAVELLPDGSIRRPIRKIKSSGITGFDEAVLNAIEKSQPYPADKSGSVPSVLAIVQKPKDQ